MPSDDNRRDVEIIPPGDKGRARDDSERLYIYFGTATSFRDLPLHKRVLLAAGWLAGMVVLGLIVFLIIASAVLIWIPLLLATILIAAVLVFFRTKFRRR